MAKRRPPVASLSDKEISMNQSPLYKVAVILFAIFSLFNIVATLPALLGGPESQSALAGMPQSIIILSALGGVAGLLAAWGAWRGEKWGIWLMIIICAVGILSALPGVLFAPSTNLRISAIVGIAIDVFVIAVLLRRPKAAIARK